MAGRKFVDKGACSVPWPNGMMRSSRRGSWLVRDHLNDRRGSFGTFPCLSESPLQNAHWPAPKRQAKQAIAPADPTTRSHPAARQRAAMIAAHTTIPNSTRLYRGTLMTNPVLTMRSQLPAIQTAQLGRSQMTVATVAISPSPTKSSSIQPSMNAVSERQFPIQPTIPEIPSHGGERSLNQCERWISLNANGSP